MFVKLWDYALVISHETYKLLKVTYTKDNTYTHAQRRTRASDGEQPPELQQGAVARTATPALHFGHSGR